MVVKNMAKTIAATPTLQERMQIVRSKPGQTSNIRKKRNSIKRIP